jgi:L-asparaginase II
MGVALKIADGATRASESAITAILVKLGVLDAKHPAAIARMSPDMHNWRGIHVGFTRPSASLL